MCDFCNIDKYSNGSFGRKELSLDWDHYTELSLRFDTHKKAFSLVAGGEGEATMVINHCPFCGRKLY